MDKRDLRKESAQLSDNVHSAMQAPDGIALHVSAFYLGVAMGILDEAVKQLAEAEYVQDRASELEKLIEELADKM